MFRWKSRVVERNHSALHFLCLFGGQFFFLSLTRVRFSIRSMASIL